MTSTTFSSKTFPSLYKWTLKRNKPIITVFSILILLGVIIDLYVISKIAEYSTGSNINEEIGDVGLISIGLLQVGAMVFTLISALMTFSFLHNKRSTDMFGSLPTTRPTIFVSHLLGGITSIAAPFLLGALVVMGITVRSGYHMRFSLLMVGFGLLGIAAAYTFTALIAYCCGTTIDTAIITAAVNAIYSGTVGVAWIMAYDMIPGMDYEELFSSPLIALFTPYSFPFFGDAYYEKEEYTALIVLAVWCVIFIAATFFLGLFASKKRRAEVSQSEFAVKWLPIAVKAGGSVVCGGLVGCIAAISSDSGYSNMLSFALWYVLIGAAAFFILHLIFARGVKGRILPSIIVYACTTVAALTFAFLFTTGLGVDTYVPSPSNVKCVYLGSEKFEDSDNIRTVAEIHKVITEGIRIQNDYPYYLGDAAYEGYIESYETYSEYPDDIEIKDTFDTPYISESMSYAQKNTMVAKQYPLVQMTDFSFRYHKKVGFSTYRQYYMYVDELDYYDYARLEELLRVLYNSEEYKRSRSENAIIWDETLHSAVSPLDPPTITYYNVVPDFLSDENSEAGLRGEYVNVGEESLPQGKEFLKKLYAAVQEDILADDEYYKTIVPTYNESDPLVSLGDSYMAIQVYYNGNEKMNNPVDDIHSRYYTYPNSKSVFIVVPTTYANTLKFLEKNGYSSDVSKTHLENVTIDPYDYINDNYGEAYTAYESFGMSGSYDSLIKCVRKIAPKMEGVALYKAGLYEDYEKWDKEHGREFEEALAAKADEVYKKIGDDPSMITSDYWNDYESETGNRGDYFYIADTIIRRLEEASTEIVKDIQTPPAGSRSASA